MDVGRATITRAIDGGAIGKLAAAGIEAHHFGDTPGGRECAEVYRWAITHARRHAVSPSQQLLSANFPQWRGEPSQDPLDALVDEFLNEVRRRHFESKLMDLGRLGTDPRNRAILDQLMLDAARDLAAIAPSGSVGRLSEMPMRVSRYEQEAFDGITTGIPMGIPLFDDACYGIRPGKVYVVSGYSSWGKSTLSTFMAVNVVEHDVPGLILSLEMNKHEVLDRIDTMIMHFRSADLNMRTLDVGTVNRWRRVASLYEKAKSDLVIVDRLGGCTIDRIYAEINRYRPYVTVVDYIQRMGSTQRGRARHENLDEAVNELKNIAEETESAIIVCSQDNRSAAETGSTETSTGGSVGILQAADVYIGMYTNDEMRSMKQIELRMLKNRGGRRISETMMRADFDTMTIEPWKETNAFSRQAPQLSVVQGGVA